MSLQDGLVATSVSYIAGVQRSDGAIPWFPAGDLDPWDHVEAAMALNVGGLHEEAAAAYRWLCHAQRRDGAWPARITGNLIADRTLDANFCAYIATGVWHHTLVTDHDSLAVELWPTICKAIDFVLDLQAPDGSIYWARDEHLRPWPAALLTSSSCIHLSLRCAVSLADLLGESRPDWELAASRLAQAVAAKKPDVFEAKDRFAMDWYYPVLGGVLTGGDARARLREKWTDFIEEGLGSRCVSDRPWVTSAETAELVIALDAAGMRSEARAVFSWVHYLRAGDGAYWTGATFPDGTVWPREKPTWAVGAIVLAADALYGITAGSEMWRHLHEAAEASETSDLPTGL